MRCRCLLTLLFFGAFIGHAHAQYKEDWAPFLNMRGDTVVSEVVDLGLKTLAPVPNARYHLTLHLTLQQPGPTGMASTEEGETLKRVESRLNQIVTENGKGVLAGVGTTKGVRTMHFYTAKPTVDTTLVATAFIFYPQYKDYKVSAVLDSTWQYYLTRLYPSPIEYQKLINSRVVEDLVRHGDGLSESRPVDHYILFRTRPDADRFVRKIKKDKFTVVAIESDTSFGQRPVRLHLTRVDQVNPVAVDRIVLPLWELANKNDAVYDGWSTVLRK